MALSPHTSGGLNCFRYVLSIQCQMSTANPRAFTARIRQSGIFEKFIPLVRSSSILHPGILLSSSRISTEQNQNNEIGSPY